MKEEPSEVSVVFVPPLGAGPEMILQSLVSLSHGGKTRYAVIDPHGRARNDLSDKWSEISGPKIVGVRKDRKTVPVHVYRFERTPMSLEEYARLVAKVIAAEDAKADRTVVIGHSIGGSVLSILASARDEFGIDENTTLIAVNPPFDAGLRRLIPEISLGMAKWTADMLIHGIYPIATAKYVLNIIRYLSAYLGAARDLERTHEIVGFDDRYSVISPEGKTNYAIVTSYGDVFNHNTRSVRRDVLDPRELPGSNSYQIVGAQTHAALVNLGGYNEEIAHVIQLALDKLGTGIRITQKEPPYRNTGIAETAGKMLWDIVTLPARSGYNLVDMFRNPHNYQLPPLRTLAKYVFVAALATYISNKYGIDWRIVGVVTLSLLITGNAYWFDDWTRSLVGNVHTTRRTDKS